MSLALTAALIRWNLMILEGIHHVGEPGRGFPGGIEKSRTVRLPNVVQLQIDVVPNLSVISITRQ